MNSEQLKAYIGVAHYVQQQADWNESNQDSVQFIQNKPNITKIEGDVNTLKSDITTLKSDVTTLKNDIPTLKSDTGTLKTDVGTLKSDVNAINTSFSTIEEFNGDTTYYISNIYTIKAINSSIIIIYDNPSLPYWKFELIPTEKTNVSHIDINAHSNITKLEATRKIDYTSHTSILEDYGKYDIEVGDKIVIEKINNLITVEHIIYLG